MKNASGQQYKISLSGDKVQLTGEYPPAVMKRPIHAQSRMADMLMVHERLLLVIERFGISLGFGDKTIGEVCALYGLDTTLVLAVMNLFVKSPIPAEITLSANMVPGLLEYLRRAHRYYLNEKLPYISELIGRFTESTGNPDIRLLQLFFKGYEKEVDEHMQLEDATVFPYIQALYSATRGDPYDKEAFRYSIDEFVEHHSDIEEKLEDLTHLLIKHFPPTKDRFYRNMILLELFELHYDLDDHDKIENQILVPLVRQLELKRKGHGK